MARALMVLLGSAVTVLVMVAAAQEQYSKPLVHTSSDHPAARVLVIQVESLHAADLARWVAEHPGSAFSELAARGVTFTNAHVPVSNPAAGLLAIATGGTPISTGISGVDGYDRELSPAGSGCKTKGTTLLLANGAGLPLDPARGCVAVTIHELVRVNTMFEVVHEKIGPTAWVGESAAMAELLRGPSGAGLDEACTVASDDERVGVVVGWIEGKNCRGGNETSVPAMFGVSLSAVAKAQATRGMGYSDAMGTPSAGLLKALDGVDGDLRRMMEALKANGLYQSTWILIAGGYGLAPMDSRQRRVVSLTTVAKVAGLVTHISGGGGAMIWLKDSAKTEVVAKTLSDQADALGIEAVVYGPELALAWNTPMKDPRAPDILLRAKSGVLWLKDGDMAMAAHGGSGDEDTHVALMVSGSQLTGRYDPTPVPTTQAAPLLLRALGMEKFDLKALHLEHSPALPGIF
jgi:hypothetical protein